MKMTKRLISLLLCAVLCLSLAAAACAEDKAEDTGILDAAELNTAIADYLAAKGIQPDRVSVAYCYTATGDCWYYNADSWMYSAMMYKVPLMMLCGEKLAGGDMSLSDQVSSTNLEQAMKAILVNDNDEYARILRNRLGGDEAWRKDAMKFSDLPEAYYSEDYVKYNYVTASYMLDVLKTLFANPENFPGVEENMKQAQPGAYFAKNITKYEVAQKFGSFTEAGGRTNCHTAGIIYTPNPILLCVMTKNVSLTDKTIGDIAALLVDYTLKVDSRLEAYRAELAEAERREAEAQAEAEAAAKAEAEAAAAAAATPAPVQQSTEKTGFTMNKKVVVYAVIGIVVVMAAIGIALALRNRALREAMEEEDEGLDILYPKRGSRNAAQYEPEYDTTATVDEAPADGGAEQPEEEDEDEEDEEEDDVKPAKRFKLRFTARKPRTAAPAEEPEDDEDDAEPEAEAAAPAVPTDTAPAPVYEVPAAAAEEEDYSGMSVEDILNEIKNGSLEL